MINFCCNDYSIGKRHEHRYEFNIYIAYIGWDNKLPSAKGENQTVLPLSKHVISSLN